MTLEELRERIGRYIPHMHLRGDWKGCPECEGLQAGMALITRVEEVVKEMRARDDWHDWSDVIDDVDGWADKLEGKDE